MGIQFNKPVSHSQAPKITPKAVGQSKSPDAGTPPDDDGLISPYEGKPKPPKPLNIPKHKNKTKVVPWDDEKPAPPKNSKIKPWK